MASSRESSQPRDRTQVSCIAGEFFTIWTTKEALGVLYITFKYNCKQLYLKERRSQINNQLIPLKEPTISSLYKELKLNPKQAEGNNRDYS